MNPAHAIQRQAAGSASRYFVAHIDGNRRIRRRLSGYAYSLADALAYLKWARRRHREAVLVRELLFLEVLA